MERKLLLLIIAITLTFGLATVAYSATNGFKDVKVGTWYHDYVMKATNDGYMSGYKDGTFKPNDNVTRAQLTKIIVEYDKQANKKIVDAIKASSTDEQAVINAVAKVIPSTVKITSDVGTGSGFFVKESVIMTNAHVVGDMTSVKVITSTGEELVGDVIAKDKQKDIALVKVSKVYKPLTFSTKLEVGMNAIAIGNPMGMDQTVTKGIVSKLVVEEFKEAVMFQMDASINSGNSGGAVINSKGQVIGMATGKLIADTGMIEGIAFAIEASELDKFMNSNMK